MLSWKQEARTQEESRSHGGLHSLYLQAYIRMTINESLFYD